MDRVRSRSRIENFDPYEMDDFDIAIEKITEFINKM